MTAHHDLEKAKEILKIVSTNDWLAHSLGTWQWWLLLVSSIVPWILWWKYADKERGRELIIVGLITMVVTDTLDSLGTFFNLWGYPIKITPVIIQYLPADFAVFPVTFMFLCQFYRKWSTFLAATVVVAAIFSYVLEPLFVYMHTYYYNAPWNHTLSFIGFIITIAMIRLGAYQLLKRLK
ncbi:CBO0543 family protein [Paenibacillus terreus]|uniref:CBO0543 family protein n=1 Tax=Paenibacillus terreus TaxID=1387834 RepID=A0ABV5B9Y9_9BACL